MGAGPTPVLAAVAHAALMVGAWAMLARTLPRPAGAQPLRTLRSWGLLRRVVLLMVALSLVEAAFVRLLATGAGAEALAHDPLRSGVAFVALYSTLLAWIALAARARQPSGSMSLGVGFGMAIAVVALTVSTLPWIDFEQPCRVGTFFFVATRSC